MSGNIAMGGNNISNGGTATFTSFVGALTGNAITATTVTAATQSNITALPNLGSFGVTGNSCFVNGNLYLNNGGVILCSGSINLGGSGNLNNANGIQLLTGTGTAGQIIVSSDTSGHFTWASPSSLSGIVTTITGTANQVLVNGTSGSVTSGAITLTTPQSIGTTSSPTFSKLTLSADTTTPALTTTFSASASNTLLQSFKVSGNKRWQWYVSGSESGANADSDFMLDCYSYAGSRINDALIITRSTGSVKLGAALDLNSQSITNGNTITATSFVGSLTGHASLDLALSGGTMSGTLNMGSHAISGVTLTGTLSTAAQANVTSLGTLTGLTTGRNTKFKFEQHYQRKCYYIGIFC